MQWHIPQWDYFSTVFRSDFFWQKWGCGENQRAQKKKPFEEDKNHHFFPSAHGNKSYNLIGSWHGPDFPISDHGHSNACYFRILKEITVFWSRYLFIIYMLFTGLGSVRIVKNCDLRPWAAFSRPWSQFFTIQTSQPANNIYIINKYLLQKTVISFQISKI